MSFTKSKKLDYLIATIAAFSILCVFSAQRISDNNDTRGNTQKISSLDQTSLDVPSIKQESNIKQNILQEFDNAFLKQYTPLLGCEDISNESKSDTCNLHLEQEKNDFKLEFIQRRGLPKDTFKNLHLSATN